MYSFKLQKDGKSVEVFNDKKSIGTLERIIDLVSEKYFNKPRYNYTVTDPVTGYKEIFSSRQNAAIRLQNLTEYYQRDENRIREKFESYFKIYLDINNLSEPDSNDDLERLAYECVLKVKGLKEEFISKAINKLKEEA